MGWKECDRVSEREEFVMLALHAEAGMSALCRRFGISRKTGYKWLERASSGEPMADRSRRPHRCPTHTGPAMEQAVLAVRRAHFAWGGRKIRKVLIKQGRSDVPAASTITGILRRHGLIDPVESCKHRAWQRFERSSPNDLWQMDFKGDFALNRGGRCYPLTILDDHSRYSLSVRACGDQRKTTVQRHLIDVFRRYGLPREMLTDNGSPWGPSSFDDRWTSLSVWLLRLDVRVLHGRPYHPQTQGKLERFHRTLKAEVLQGRTFDDLAEAQDAFDPWRPMYNCERPHEALGMATPGERYEPSRRDYPQALPPIEYDQGVVTRTVAGNGYFQHNGRRYRVGKAFRGLLVALRPTSADGHLDVYFCRQRIARVNERDGEVRRASSRSVRLPLAALAPDGQNVIG